MSSFSVQLVLEILFQQKPLEEASSTIGRVNYTEGVFISWLKINWIFMKCSNNNKNSLIPYTVFHV